MQDPKDPNKRKDAPSQGSQQQQPDKARNSQQGQDRNNDSQVENDQKEVVVNEQEQDRITNQPASGNPDHSTTDRERSFYKNDLPENEEGTDVDERSSSIQP